MRGEPGPPPILVVKSASCVNVCACATARHKSIAGRMNFRPHVRRIFPEIACMVVVLLGTGGRPACQAIIIGVFWGCQYEGFCTAAQLGLPLQRRGYLANITWVWTHATGDTNIRNRREHEADKSSKWRSRFSEYHQADSR